MGNLGFYTEGSFFVLKKGTPQYKSRFSLNLSKKRRLRLRNSEINLTYRKYEVNAYINSNAKSS
jgi:hypothetical protein